jgi:peptide-methionine (S)-S-oxide reductase
MKPISIILFLLCLFSLSAHAEKAIFAGGCFWCSEADFEKLDGVMNVISGYTGGQLKTPSYEQVSQGGTGHYEAVEVDFNPEKISYEQLLNHFWRSIDPFDADGQFCDKGESYRSAIFTYDASQQQIAQQTKASLQKQFGNKQSIVTKILPASDFYPAEKHHQNYYKNNKLRYDYYRWACGRDARLKQIWQ